MNELPIEHLALMIPILAILLTFGFLTLHILFKYLRRRRLVELYHRERMTAMDKGIELPPLPLALLDSATPQARNPGRALLKGLIWLFVGLGLFFAVREHERPGALFCLVPIGVGFAYILYYLIEGRRVTPPTRPSDPGSGAVVVNP